MEEHNKPTGEFRLKVFRNGELIEDFVKNNLIVNLGRATVVKLLANDGPNKYISKIAFGTSSVAPVLGDSALTSEFVKSINGFSYPATGSVKFDWSLELSENNGVNIAEYGLKSNDGTLFARVTRAVVAKDGTIRLEGSWTLNF